MGPAGPFGPERAKSRTGAQMVPVSGRKVVRADCVCRFLVRQATAFWYLAPYFSAKVSTAAFAAGCVDFGSLFRTWDTSWIQQRNGGCSGRPPPPSRVSERTRSVRESPATSAPSSREVGGSREAAALRPAGTSRQRCPRPRVPVRKREDLNRAGRAARPYRLPVLR